MKQAAKISKKKSLSPKKFYYHSESPSVINELEVEQNVPGTIKEI